MSRLRSAPSLEPPSPESLLQKASLARTPLTRAKYAKRGLSHRGALDRTTRVVIEIAVRISLEEAERCQSALNVAAFALIESELLFGLTCRQRGVN